MKYTRIALNSISYAPLLSSNQQITKSVCFLHAKKKAHSSCPLWYRADALEMFMRILFAIIRDQFISLTQISQISRNIRRYRSYVHPDANTRQGRQARAKRRAFCEICDICVKINHLCEDILVRRAHYGATLWVCPYRKITITIN